LSQDTSITGQTTGTAGGGTRDGNGMAIAAVILGIADLVVMGIMFAVAAKNGGSFYWNVG
jgi:hypothetical protein